MSDAETQHWLTQAARFESELSACEKARRELVLAASEMIAALDDMHAKGETFTARVSVVSARLRALVEGRQ